MRIVNIVFKRLIIVIILHISSLMLAQEENHFSFQFSNLTLKEALDVIEAKTDFTFYYQNNWFDNSKITKVYNQLEIKLLLEDLLEESVLNFAIYNNKIILTKNSIIQNDLPINYFSNNYNKKSNQKKPIILKDFVGDGKTIITIGKEGSSSKEYYILSGYVKSLTTNQFLNEVKVFIPKSNLTTYTNNKGYFSFSVPGGYNSIETELQGYENSNKEIVVFGKGVLNFSLEDEIVSLGEVVIRSDVNENIKKASIGLIKVDIKGVKTIPTVLGEQDILRIATTMPGIKTTGEGALGYNVRGGKTDQNLILLDHAVLYNPSHFFGVFSAINPFSTGDVAIYKGTIPAEFGGRLSSVIDISTKKVNKTKFSGEGNVGPITGNLTVEIPLKKDKTALLLGIRSTYSDWILKKIPREALKNSEASFLDGILRFESKINDKNNFKATAYYSKDQFSISSDSIYNYSNQLASLEWKHKYNAKNKASVQLSNSNYGFGIIYEGIINKNFDLNYKINETSFKYKQNYMPNKIHRINYGVTSKLYNIAPGELKPLGDLSDIKNRIIPKEKALESAIFITDAYDITDKLLLDVGFRYSFYATLGVGSQNIYASGVPMSNESIVEIKNYTNNEIMKTYAAPEIRISSRYFLKPNLSLKVGYNKTVQYLHRLSSNTTASPVDTWKLANLNIKPLKSDQYSIGLFQNLKDNEYEISLETYYKKMDNILDFRVGAELLLNESIETELLSGEGKAYGIEFLLKKKYGKLNGWLSYSYSKSLIKLESDFLTDQVNGGNFFPASYDKPHDLSLIANYKLTQRYSFSFNFSYQTGRPVTYPIGKYEFAGFEHVLYSDRNQYRIPDYYRFDVGINIEGNHKIKKLAHSFWNISVYNVLGRNNPYSVFFVNNKGEIKAYQASIFAIPIPTITYNFKF